MTNSKQIQLVLDILKNEVDGDINAALEKMHEQYSMTWMYKHPKREQFFPTTPEKVKEAMSEAYPIKGRTYDIRNVAEGEGVVMIELIERYPDPETGKLYQTPLVIVLELQDGKIKTGRHYCDPNLSYEDLTSDQINDAYRETISKQMIAED